MTSDFDTGRRSTRRCRADPAEFLAEPPQVSYGRSVLRQLSAGYGQAYERLLGRVAELGRIKPPEVSLFWPKVGRDYDGDFLVVGRAVNGWIDKWNTDQATDPRLLAAAARATAEATVNGCPMGWVLDRWKRGDGDYDTSRSQFWVTARSTLVGQHPDWEGDWPSHLTWSNLAKVSRWSKGNPSWRLRQAQLSESADLLRREVEELRPRRVVVFAGRGWFEPYAALLGLNVKWSSGLVEGVASEGDRRWIIAVHPMTRSPDAVALAVSNALER